MSQELKHHKFEIGTIINDIRRKIDEIKPLIEPIKTKRKELESLIDTIDTLDEKGELNGTSEMSDEVNNMDNSIDEFECAIESLSKDCGELVDEIEDILNDEC